MRTLRWLHLWAGLVLTVPLIVLGLTGALLTVVPWLPDGAPVASPGEPRPANEILAAARALAPQGMRVARYLPPQGPGAVAAVGLQPAGSTTPGRGGTTLRLDPVTLASLGTESGGGVVEWLRGLHVNFLVPQYAGRSIVGWCGAALVLLTVLGIPIWWPTDGRWREAFTIAPGARGVRFHRRLHGAVGIWIVPVLLVNAVTGAMLGFPQTVRGLMGLPPGGPPRTAPAQPGVPPPAVDLDAAFALLRAAAPGTVPRMALLPAQPGEPLRVFLVPPGGHGAAVSSTATLSADGTRLVGLQTPQAMPPGERVFRWAHDLHEGEGLGPVWRALTFLAGVATLVFTVTGPAMWLLKRRNRRRIALARAAAQAGE